LAVSDWSETAQLPAENHRNAAKHHPGANGRVNAPLKVQYECHRRCVQWPPELKKTLKISLLGRRRILFLKLALVILRVTNDFAFD
jgi:hypothetical protein